MDFLSGILVYVITMMVFDRALSLIEFFMVVFFAHGPDLDFVPFVLFRKRFCLTSHWFIHFPLLYLPLGSVLVGLVIGGLDLDQPSGWFFLTTFW